MIILRISFAFLMWLGFVLLSNNSVSFNSVRTDTLPPGQRIVKKFGRKDQQGDIERVEVQRRNWHDENWRNNRDTGRRQQMERQPSPETCRKHVEQPKPASPDTGLRHGKIASALELAQAFSRSFSDRKLAGRCSGQRSLPGNVRLPLSRSTGGPNP
ncbi:hypothetical protein OIU76_026066 [Salix suchowensis]|nr:hypothetical protein OIU76_026066 [Salix suchowensis]